MEVLARSLKQQVESIGAAASAGELVQIIATYDRLKELGASFSPDTRKLMDGTRNAVITSFIEECFPQGKREQIRRIVVGERQVEHA